MSTSYHDDPAPTSPREVDYFLHLLKGPWLDVELRSTLKGPRPRVVDMSVCCAERDVWVCLRDFLLQRVLVHGG